MKIHKILKMLKGYFSTVVHQAKILLSHHKNFTNFQKVLICSVTVGVSLCIFRNLWITFVAVTYTLALYASFTVTKYVATRQETVASDSILIVFENIWDVFLSIKNALFLPQEGTPANKHNLRSEIDPANAQGNCDGECKGNCEEKYDKTFKTEYDAEAETYRQLRYVERSQRPSQSEFDLLSPEIDKLIKLIKQDFITSWIKLITEDNSVLHESELLLQHIFHGFHGRLYRVDHMKVINIIILMFRDHLHNIKRAQLAYKAQRKRRKSSSSTSSQQGDGKSQFSRTQTVYKSVEECFGAKVEMHPAAKSTECETCYLKSVIELLLIHLLREDLLESKALFCALKELLMFNVLQNVINLLSDSTFLHERIIKILSDEQIVVNMEALLPAKATDQNQFNDPESETKPSDSCNEDFSDLSHSQKDAQGVLCNEIKRNSHVHFDEATDDANKDTDAEKVDEGVAKWQEDVEIHTVTKGLCFECNRLCSVDKDRISPRPHSCSLGTTPIYFDPNMKDPDEISLNSVMSFSSVVTSEGELYQTPLQDPEFHDAENDLDEPNCDCSENRESCVQDKEEGEHAKGPESQDENISCVKTEASDSKKSESHLFNFNISPLPLPNPISSFPFMGKRSSTAGTSNLSSSPVLQRSELSIHGKV